MAAVSTAVAVAGCSSGSSTSTSGGDGDGGDGGDSGDGGSTSSNDDGSGSKWTQTSTVDMTASLKYAPKRIEVEQGTTVTWKNTGNIGHTVTAYEDEIPEDASYFASGGFDSQQAAVDGYNNDNEGNVPKGESYEYTFETKGTYKYYCVPHEMNGMVGYVKVV